MTNVAPSAFCKQIVVGMKSVENEGISALVRHSLASISKVAVLLDDVCNLSASRPSFTWFPQR